MTLRHMKIFLAVCSSGCSVTAAAKELFMSQPSVTIAIRDIEEHYGVRLFDRIGRRLYLTSAGEQFRDYAQRILALQEDLDKSMEKNAIAGPIRIGASMTIGSRRMPEYVRRYLETQAAEQEDSIRVTVAPSRELEEKLLSNELDLALVEIPVHSDALTVTKYMEDTLEIIAPAEYGRAEGKKKKTELQTVMQLGELAAQRFLLREKGSGTRDIFDRAMADQGIEISPVWESASTSALIYAVECGMGLSVIPRQLAQPVIKKGTVCRVIAEELELRQSFYIVHHRDKFLTPAMQNFIGIVQMMK